MGNTTADSWRAQLKKFHRFAEGVPTMESSVMIYDAYSPVFRVVYEGLMREAELVQGPAGRLAEALDAYEKDPSTAIGLGEAIFQFTRAFDRVLRLRDILDAERHRVLDGSPTLAQGRRGDADPDA